MSYLHPKFILLGSRSITLSAIILTALCAAPMVTNQSQATPVFEAIGATDNSSPFSIGGSQGVSTSYFNPAGLSFNQNQLIIGFVAIHQDLELKFFTRPNSANISDRIYQAQAIDTKQEGLSTPLPSSNLRSPSLDREALQQTFMQFGLLRTLWKKRISLGLHMLLPIHRFEFQSPGFVDERAQYFNNQLKFERWGDTLEGLSMALAGAFRLSKQLSLGLGITILNQAIASSQVFLSDASYEGLSVISPTVEVYSAFSPSFSLMWQNSSGSTPTMLSRNSEAAQSFIRASSSIFLTVFAPQEVNVAGDSKVKIWNYPYQDGQNSIIQRFNQSYRTLPLRVRWGGELPLNNDNLGRSHSYWTLFSGGQWSRWSQYKDRNSESPSWSDQVELSAGFKWSKDKTIIASDLRWRPSPVPLQTGRSSYVDPHQLALAINGTYPLYEQFHLKLNLQGHALLSRTDRKDPKALYPVLDEFPASVDQVSGEVIEESLGLQSNNPGYPGYQSSGWVWIAGLHLVWYE